MKFAQLVIGPAGCGKSTYCNTIQQHCHACGRSVHVFNLGTTHSDSRCRSFNMCCGPSCCGRVCVLQNPPPTHQATHCVDPAAEEFAYEPSSDIRDLISVDDVVQELDLGPNGCAHSLTFPTQLMSIAA